MFRLPPLVNGQVIDAGANALVAGSAVFGAPSYKDGQSDRILSPKLFLFFLSPLLFCGGSLSVVALAL
jgi:hypothetical protein